MLQWKMNKILEIEPRALKKNFVRPFLQIERWYVDGGRRNEIYKEMKYCAMSIKGCQKNILR